MAFWYFREQKVDYAVVEVGLGGLLDSTNVVEPVVSVITNVAMDHMAYLGDTLEKIAHQKAGIIKEGVPVVTAAQHIPLKTIKKEAHAKNPASISTDGTSRSTAAANGRTARSWW